MRSIHKILAIIAVMLGALVFANPAAASVTFTFTSGTDVAVTGSNYTASGALNLTLAFTPTPGTNLTVVKNTGLPFLSGTFSGVPQGGTVPLTFNGQAYNYIANYYGGNGRSFVLQSPCVGLGGWGYADRYALGCQFGSVYEPIVVNPIRAMAGKTLVAIAGGDMYSMALTANGQVFTWGYNEYGQLGNNSTWDDYAPQAVGGALADKTVVAIAGGRGHSLALTSEGLVFAWGGNHSGQLGNGSSTDSLMPVAVNTSGALTGKTVVAISAGVYHSLALTSDGKIFAWGSDGNNSSSEPVEVNTRGALAGKSVVAIAAGGFHSLALTSDGQVFAWGRNDIGQLGNDSRTSSSDPVAVNTSGALNGKTVVAVAVGRGDDGSHSLALTSDGLVFAWGLNNMGSLGIGSVDWSLVPVAVSTSGALEGKTVTSIAAGDGYSMALTSDGHVFTWGKGVNGQLGSAVGNSLVPIPVSGSSALAGKSVVSIAAGFNHNLVLFGLNPPLVTADPENFTCSPSNMGAFSAAATDFPAITTIQWQVSTTGTAGPFSDIDNYPPPLVASGTLDLGHLYGLKGNAYRAIFTNQAGSSATKAASLLYPAPSLTVPNNITANADSRSGAYVRYDVTASDSFDGNLLPDCAPSPCFPFPIGTTTVNCSAKNSHGVISTASFTVTVLRTFASFRDQHGLLNAAPTADTKRTGVCNLAAYAFGVDPGAPDRAQLPLATVQGGGLQISYPRWKDAADVGYVVEVSDDLQTWHSGTDYTEPVSVTSIDATREQVIERDRVPIANAPRRFIRVRLTH